MESDVPLDYAVFQLSPKRSRCELFVSYDGTTEKLASGLVKPFVTNLKVAEEQVALARKSIKLDVERFNDAETWFTKGTLERFVRFVSTPEVLEMVNTFDAEMSQLEAARKIYSQEPADVGFGRVGNGATVASDATKKELLRAIDVRLSAVKQDLVRACSRASAAGFNPETVSGLQSFADHFGAHRLSEACSIFITNTQRRADLFNSDNAASTWKAPSDSILRSSTGSDMSLDDPISEQPKPSTCTTSKITTSKIISSSHHFSREPSPSPVDVDEKESSKDKPLESTTSATTSTTESVSTSSGKPQLTRRLSVQERISLFENKAQVSPSTTTTPTTTTPTSTGGKPELRRLSSEVTLSTDKAVLRRWSGASDMSIDISGERKEPDGNANIPTPSPGSSTRSLFPPKSKDLNDPKSEEGDNSIKLPVSAGLNSKIPSLSGRSSVKDQRSAGLQPSAMPFGRTEEVEIENQSTPYPTQIESQQFGSPSQSSTEDKQNGLSGEGSIREDKTGKGSELSTKNEGTLVGIQGERNNNLLSDQQVLVSQFSDFQRRVVEGELDSATSEVESVPLSGQQKWNSVGEAEKVGQNVFESLEIQTESHSMPMKTSGLLGVKFSVNDSSPNQVTKSGGRKESGTKVSGAQMGLTEKGVIKNQEAFPSMHMDQVQRVREPKGNQGVNDELKMKANELEKLFAAHKLRIPGDQSNSASRVRPTKTDKEVESGFVNGMQERKASPARSSTMKPMGEPAGSSTETEKLYSTPLLKSVDNHDYDVTPHHNIQSLSFSDDSKGKLYQKYMRKRDAKLREDWSSNRPEKEAQMKAMQESLEESRAEMKVKLAGSADKKLAEKFLGDSSTKSAQSKRVQPNKNISSPSTRQSTASTPRTPVKVSNSAAGRRRLPNDNPVAQSVPNFSDLRKENTKSSSLASKPIRPVGRVHARKKSTSEDLLSVNEEKPRRSQLLRKNSASTTELNTSRNSDDVDNTKFMSSKYHSEENEDYEEFSNGMEFKTLQRKGSAGSGMGVSKAPVMGEAARNGQSFLDTGFGTEEMVDMTQNEDYETTLAEESTYIDNNKGRLSNASDKYGNSGYENNNALRFVSQAKSDPAADLPNSMPSLFRSLGSTLDSPGESPGSWNSRLPNPFAYSHEILDIDASDSPPGSPDTLSQSEAEAARIRKKWGAAQKPVVGIDSSHTQSRKDLTRGLKRFLNFGRKNRASESLADWISVTTSEGDDSEDGRDIANRSSEDLRKSRMGFSQSHNSDEGFHESNMFNEQVQALRSSIPTPPPNFKLREENLSESSLKAPKSFFSLSNFRSKANDSKPR
ncbi:uncharacterized protein LOC141613458 isoform X2 [Silene latifolia]|uniref:uncharacterized protein LOC141613458 isoform X2 n=1 Tax=Silene latifolia TaxID=37657 RepID=UPI003D7816AE